MIDLDSSVVSVVTVLGLGLCIDYGLLLTSRFREELRIRAATGALERTLATAGRTVLFSGLTVAVSLAGLMLFSATVLRAVGAAGVSVVAVALLVALTLVPALLDAGGPAAGAARDHAAAARDLRRLGRRLGDVAPEHGAFSRLAVDASSAGRSSRWSAVLGVLAVARPARALQLRLVSSGVALLPRTAPSRQLFDQVAARFPAANAAGRDRRQPVVPGAARRSGPPTATSPRSPGSPAVDPVRVQENGGERVSVLGVRVAGARTAGGLTVPDPTSDQARAVVRVLQQREAGRASPIWVTGQAAFVDDFLDDVKTRAPLAAGVVVLATFVLLFLLDRVGARAGQGARARRRVARRLPRRPGLGVPAGPSRRA